MGGRADFSRHESQPTMTIAAGLSLGCPVSHASICSVPSLLATFLYLENLAEAGR